MDHQHFGMTGASGNHSMFLDCADMSALFMGRHVARIQSVDVSPHAKALGEILPGDR